jgi:trimeric autotransporter adhesin
MALFLAVCSQFAFIFLAQLEIGKGEVNSGLVMKGDGAATQSLNDPMAVDTDSDVGFYISDKNRIYHVAADGQVRLVAGNGVSGFSGDGGKATSAQLNEPDGIAVDSAGNIYIADRLNNRVRKVTPAGAITTVAGN